MNRIALGALALAGWTVVRRARQDIARARAAYDDRVEWELQKIIEDAQR